MLKNSSYLVIGANSFVGGALIKVLQSRGYKTYGTTRRADQVSKNMLYLDFADVQSFEAPMNTSYSFVVAAATNYKNCEENLEARKTNEEYTPLVIANLLDKGGFVTFISSNTVFGGDRQWPSEDCLHDPNIPYADQKSNAEKAVCAVAKEMHAEQRLNIVRLTKVLDISTPPLPDWFFAWEQKNVVKPFTDLIFAPMSLKYVAESLASIGEKRISGNLHLSGSKNISYFDFTQSLAKKIGISEALIDPTTSETAGIHVPFKPKFSGIGMERTTQLTGIKPQEWDMVVDDLVAQLLRIHL